MKELWLLLALMAAGCGSGSAPNAPNNPASTEAKPDDVVASELQASTPAASMLGGSAGPEIQVIRTGKIRLLPTTRMAIARQFEPGVVAAINTVNRRELAVSNGVSDICTRTFRKIGRDDGIMASPGQIADDGVNILVTLTIGPNAAGAPYRVSLSARQGAARWSGAIERATYRDIPGFIPISPNQTTPDGLPYWEPSMDANTLAKRLCNEIVRRK